MTVRDLEAEHRQLRADLTGSASRFMTRANGSGYALGQVAELRKPILGTVTQAAIVDGPP